MSRHASSPDSGKEEVYYLVTQALCGDISDAETRRFERLISDDPQARRVYVEFICDASNLRTLVARGRVQAADSGGGGGGGLFPAAGAPVLGFHNAPDVLDAEPPLDPGEPVFVPISESHCPQRRVPFVGSWPFSYMVSALLMAVAALAGWTYTVRLDTAAVAQRSAPQPFGPVGEPEMTSVGRITGMNNCLWANGRDADVEAAIPLGHKYELAAGLLEISYQSGATVILQGPCAYEVDSPAGGFLSLGKLTARVETKREGGREKAEGSENPKSEIQNPKFPFPPHPSPFVVRTPTAVVTDLGTEFGVEVDKSGATRSLVFRGRVELRVAEEGAAGDRVIPLGENESAQVGSGKGRAVTVTRAAGRETGPPQSFVRQMPARAPIEVLNTGLGLREGDPDPHWQIVAVSNDPHFKPRPAVVTVVAPNCLPNNPDWSQSVSTAGDLPRLPHNVTWTFRTTFELPGLVPGTAALQGHFLVDNHVSAIRLNGRPVQVPEHPFDDYGMFYNFAADKGFVEGLNTLEIVVFNGRPGTTDPASPMLLRVELKGNYLSVYRPPAKTGGKPAAESPQKGGEPMNGP